MKEAVEKTLHDLDFAVRGFREALGKASNVEAIILLDLIEDTADLRRKAEALLCAHICDNGSGK